VSALHIALISDDFAGQSHLDSAAILPCMGEWLRVIRLPAMVKSARRYKAQPVCRARCGRPPGYRPGRSLIHDRGSSRPRMGFEDVPGAS
jgi:hypothetical protein